MNVRRRLTIDAFQAESNKIEGIHVVRIEEVSALDAFLDLPEIRIADLCNYANVCAGERAVLRQSPGMDVQVGDHVAPKGGDNIPYLLRNLLDKVNNVGGKYSDGLRSPYTIHHEYESLHPFIDGNGRSGRALWAWQMIRSYYAHPESLYFEALSLGFLHSFYYQTLSAGR